MMVFFLKVEDNGGAPRDRPRLHVTQEWPWEGNQYSALALHFGSHCGVHYLLVVAEMAGGHYERVGVIQTPWSWGFRRDIFAENLNYMALWLY